MGLGIAPEMVDTVEAAVDPAGAAEDTVVADNPAYAASVV